MGETHLHRYKTVVHHDLLREAVRSAALSTLASEQNQYSQVGPNGSLVLVAEPLVHILVHKRRLADTEEPQITRCASPRRT